MSDSVEGRHSDEAYLEAVRDHEPAATSEIAAAVGVARQSADYRLRQLEEEGRVTSKKIGSSLAWSLAEGVLEIHEVDPSDAFWDAETYVSEPTSASEIDAVVYDDPEPE